MSDTCRHLVVKPLWYVWTAGATRLLVTNELVNMVAFGPDHAGWHTALSLYAAHNTDCFMSVSVTVNVRWWNTYLTIAIDRIQPESIWIMEVAPLGELDPKYCCGKDVCMSSVLSYYGNRVSQHLAYILYISSSTRTMWASVLVL